MGPAAELVFAGLDLFTIPNSPNDLIKADQAWVFGVRELEKLFYEAREDSGGIGH
jgi:hypothetical protein